MSFLDVQMSLFTTTVHLSLSSLSLLSLSLPPSLPLSLTLSLFLTHAHTLRFPIYPQTKRNETRERKENHSIVSHHIYLFVARGAASQPCIFIDVWKYIKIKIRPYIRRSTCSCRILFIPNITLSLFLINNFFLLFLSSQRNPTRFFKNLIQV